MNAEELVAAIRADHFEATMPPAGCYFCTTEWPCPPALAADRIEKALAFANQDYRGPDLNRPLRTALNGES